MNDQFEYRGHTVSSWFYGLDYIGLVDGEELPNFYLTSQAARDAGKRHVDEVEKSNDKV